MSRLFRYGLALILSGVVGAAMAMPASGRQLHKSFRLCGNTWWVGSERVRAMLIAWAAGHILIGAPLLLTQFGAEFTRIGQAALLGVLHMGVTTEQKPAIHVLTLCLAILALAARTIEEGLQAHSEVERYRS
ncbi:MAG: hypothetical protein ACTS5I_16345, partial [Rhodanobacter sp.]